MASWVRGTDESTAAGIFDGEQIESPAMSDVPPWYANASDQEVRDHIWLEYTRRGADPRRLAKMIGVGKSTVYAAIERARMKEDSHRSEVKDPIVEPIFGVNAFTPDSPCAHPQPFPAGAAEYCPGCHQTGVEGHPALRRRQGEIDPIRTIQYRPGDGLEGGTDGAAKRKTTRSRKERVSA